jgi:hypothetical protein
MYFIHIVSTAIVAVKMARGKAWKKVEARGGAGVN